MITIAGIKDMDLIRRHIMSKQGEINDEFRRLAVERDEYKRRLEARERDQNKMDSKIRALEMVIN